MLRRTLIFIYGLKAYLLFLVTILYAIGFVTGFGVPKTIDDGVVGPAWLAVLVNVSILGVFAIQHTIMARPAFKRWWTRIIPPSMERSTFVLVTCTILLTLFWQWRPLPGLVWHFDQPAARWALTAISLGGWALVFYSSFLIDHFDLFGLRHVILHLRRRPYTAHPFVERSLYRVVRHPLMVGFLIAFWFTPTMTAGHLLFAGITTAYIILGTAIEERTLLAELGRPYDEYRRRTPMFLPRFRPKPAGTTASDLQVKTAS